MKKIITSRIALIMSMALLASCGGSKEEDLSNSNNSQGTLENTVEIDFMINWDIESGRGKNIQIAVDEFNKSQDDIKVTLMSGTQDAAALTTTIMGNNPPEVIQLGAKETKSLGSEGLLYDMNDYEEKADEIFYESVVDVFKTKDDLYGIPWIGHSIQLVYNKDLFREAGLDAEVAPSTWEEVIEFAKIIEENTGVDGVAMGGAQHTDVLWMFGPIVYAYGNDLISYDENGNQYLGFDNENGLEALKVYAELAQNYTNSAEKNGGSTMEDFRNGSVAMEFQGPWGVTDIWKSGNPFEVGVASMPMGSNRVAADIGPNALTIPSTIEGETYEAAVTFINYMVTEEAQQIIMQGEYDEATDSYYPYRVPMRVDMVDNIYFKENPEFIPFIEGMKDGVDTVPTSEYVQVANEILLVELNSLALGRTTPEETLSNIISKGNARLEEIQ